MKATMRDIIIAVSKASEITPKQILGDCRKRRFARVRMAIYVLGRENGHTSSAIGRAVKKDHSTVTHGIQSAQHYIESGHTDGEFIEKYLADARILLAERDPVAPWAGYVQTPAEIRAENAVDPIDGRSYPKRTVTDRGYIDNRGQIICDP